MGCESVVGSGRGVGLTPSYEVLRRLGYQGYLLTNEGDAIQGLPLAIQKQIAYGDWGSLRAYWRENSKTQADNLGDRSFQSLGALSLLRTTKPHWERLLNIGQFNTCANFVGPGSFKRCSPDLTKFKSLRHELQALGFTAEDLRR